MIFTYIPTEKTEIPFLEVCRYAGIKKENIPENVKNEISECIKEAEKIISPKVCYMRVPIEICGNTVNFGVFKVESESLTKNLKDSDNAYIFAATIGTGIDVLINRYSTVSPVKALYFQAIGATAVESVCDNVCDTVFEPTRPRFSPGYGDFSISHQRDFINILDCQRKIGLYLTDGNMLVPSKSVTAVAGITSEKNKCRNKCELCENIGCNFKVESEQNELKR